MGYYTDYTLSYELPKDVIEDVENAAFLKKCQEAGISIPETVVVQTQNLAEKLHEAMDAEDACEYGSLMSFYNEDADSCKWYNHEEDMRKFSEKFPNVLFKLEGRGEEQGDSWIKYFKNGKMQHCPAKISYDKFNERKLV